MVDQVQVSVIIPCYRCADTIGRALASIVKQTLRPKEVIMIDDFSSDDTLNELYRLQTMHPEGWIKIIALSQNDGPGTARNIGWDSATQPFIAFLDSDDAWHPQKIELQYLWMLAHPEVALTGHASQHVKGSSEPSTNLIYEASQTHFKLISKARLLISNQFPTRSVMLRRKICQRFLRGKKYAEDYLLWCEICCSGLPCYRSGLPLAYLFKATYGAGGLSGDLMKMQKGELDTYRHLYTKQYFGIGVLIFLTYLSCLKYISRLLKVIFFSDYHRTSASFSLVRRICG